MESDKAAAEADRLEVLEEQEAAKEVEEECQARQLETEQEVAEAEPILEKALEGMKKLQVAQLREIKSMANPGPAAVLTMTAVCHMMGVNPIKKPGARGSEDIVDYWAAAQANLLRDPKKFLEELLEFDRDHINEEVIKKVAPIIEREEFEPAVVKKASVACEVLCRWVRSMVKYHETMKSVLPKREKLGLLTAELEEIGRHYLPNATCLMRPHLVSTALLV